MDAHTVSQRHTQWPKKCCDRINGYANELIRLKPLHHLLRRSAPSPSPPSDQSPPSGSDILHEWPTSTDNPRNWSRGRKWRATLTSCFMSCLVSMAASAYSQATDQIAQEFNASQLLAVSGISFFTIAVAVFPAFLAPLCESFGRQKVYLASYAIFFIFFLPLALARNIGTILVARFINGAAGSAGATIVGGTLSDLWEPDQRAVPMALFALSALLGTPLGVVLFTWAGGPAVTWRWIFWSFLLLAVPSALLIVLFFRTETFPRRARLYAQAAVADSQASSETATVGAPSNAGVRQAVFRSALRPLYLLATEPIALALSLWIAFAWGTLYLFLESVPLVFEPYGFTHPHMTRGLSFVGTAIGSLVGVTVHLFVLWRRKGKATSEPEQRLYEACVGAFLFASGFFVFAWTAQPGQIHWIVPQLGTSIILTGMFMVYICIFDFLSDCYGVYSSSAIAAQSFLRNIFATGFPLAAQKMYTNLTYPWASSLLGFVAFVLAFVPILLLWKGKSLRQRSAFAVSGLGKL